MSVAPVQPDLDPTEAVTTGVTASVAPAGPPATRRRRAVTGGLWSAASQVVPALGTAVLSVAAGRLLGGAALGQQSLIAYVNSAVSAVVIYSLNTALLQIGGRLQGRGDARALRALTRWSLGAHLASGVVVLATMGVAAVLVDHNPVAWGVIGAVSVLDAAVDGLAVRLILTEGWGPVGRLRLVFQLIGPPLGVAFVLAGGGITGIFVGDGLAALGLLIAVAIRFRTRRGLPLTDARPVVVEAPTPEIWGLRRGRWQPLHPAAPRGGRFAPPVRVARTYLLFALHATVTQVVSRRVEFVVLAVLATDTAIGMYSVAFMAVNLVAMVPLGIATAAMPLVAAAAGRGELPLAVRHLRLALRLGTSASVPLVAALAVTGPYAVLLVYGGEYREAARLVPLASLTLLVAVVSGVCGQFWAGQGRLRVVLLAGAGAAVVDLAVAFGLVPLLGALGAVGANLAAQVVLAAALLRATVRDTGPVGWRVRPLLATAGCAVVAAALAAVAARACARGFDGVEPAAAAGLLTATLVFAGLYLALARLVGVFSPDERDWLAPLLPGPARRVVTGLTRHGGAG